MGLQEQGPFLPWYIACGSNPSIVVDGAGAGHFHQAVERVVLIDEVVQVCHLLGGRIPDKPDVAVCPAPGFPHHLAGIIDPIGNIAHGARDSSQV